MAGAGGRKRQEFFADYSPAKNPNKSGFDALFFVASVQDIGFRVIEMSKGKARPAPWPQ